ncbi:hypothetical protein Back2_24140 [Nocardioides baekrokdamisoli]|uniref:Uncharacterized protein n=1 Tax=Nocardioides baekrokdamisoli TaxID=1804624 RepID=A0A3G9IGJ9_9ACTN|nr:hypothetical protein Back2_24140 [Nocardioides baekrokdamisoli]
MTQSNVQNEHNATQSAMIFGVDQTSDCEATFTGGSGDLAPTCTSPRDGVRPSDVTCSHINAITDGEQVICGPVHGEAFTEREATGSTSGSSGSEQIDSTGKPATITITFNGTDGTFTAGTATSVPSAIVP